MSQLVDTGNGVAEFPDEMSHDEIAGVIKKQFYSPDNPPPAEISANDAELQKLGVDTARPEDSFDPTSNSAQILTGVAKGVGSIIPKSVGEAAKMLTYTPVEETPHALKEAYDVIRGVSTQEAVPESQTLTGFLDKSLSEKSQILTQQLALLAMAGLGLRGALRPHPTLSEKLAPITGEVPKVEAPPVHEVTVVPTGAAAKPETLTPQEEVTPQGQVEPVGVTETLAELKRRNVVTPGEVEVRPETPTPLPLDVDSVHQEYLDNPSPDSFRNLLQSVASLTPEEFAKESYHNRQSILDAERTPEILAFAKRFKILPEDWTTHVATQALRGTPKVKEAAVAALNSVGLKARNVGKHMFTPVIEGVHEWTIEKARQEGVLVPEVSQAPVESGLQAKPELPENTEVTIKASTSKDEPLEVKMDAREAEKVLNERKTAFENLIDCLG